MNRKVRFGIIYLTDYDRCRLILVNVPDFIDSQRWQVLPSTSPLDSLSVLVDEFQFYEIEPTGGVLELKSDVAVELDPGRLLQFMRKIETGKKEVGPSLAEQDERRGEINSLFLQLQTAQAALLRPMFNAAMTTIRAANQAGMN